MDRTTTTTTTHLQGIGHVPAKTAQELRNGDIVMWNFGYTSLIVDIVPRGKTQLVAMMVEQQSGTFTQRVMKRTTLIGMKVTL